MRSFERLLSFITLYLKKKRKINLDCNVIQLAILLKIMCFVLL